MTLPQTILFVILIILSIFLIIVGLQLISLLHEARKTLKKVDSLLTNIDFLIDNFTRSTNTLTQISTGLKSGLEIVSVVSQLFNHHSRKRK